MADDFYFELAEHLQGIASDDLIYIIAQMGNGVGSDAYAEVPANMSRRPTNMQEAYEQAYFFTALAAQRALRLEDERKIPFGSARTLLNELPDLAQSLVAASAGESVSLSSESAVLSQTKAVIEKSALPSEDKAKIVGFISSNLTSLFWHSSLPWMGGLALGGIVLAAALKVRGRTVPPASV